jgi:hypothetical protein
VTIEQEFIERIIKELVAMRELEHEKHLALQMKDCGRLQCHRVTKLLNDWNKQKAISEHDKREFEQTRNILDQGLPF